MSAGQAGGAGPGAHRRVSLEQVSVPRLLFALLHQRFTGTLLVQQPPPAMGTRSVWLRGGMPVLTDWVAPGDVLGQVLVDLGLVEPAAVQRALEAMASQGGLLGTHLVAMGALDRSRLLEGLRQQCSRKLFALFGLRGGEAVISVGEAPGLEADLLPVNVLGVVLAGVTVAYDEVRVAEETGPTLEGPLRATGALARYRPHFRFRPADEPILAALEQGTTLAQLGALPGASPRRASQVAFVLWACQMLRTGGAAEAAAPAPAPAAATARPRVPTPAPVAATARPRVATPVPTPAPVPSEGLEPAAATPGAPAPRRRMGTLTDVGGPVATADETFTAELEALEAKVARGAHAFDLFGLQPTATKRDVRSAWAELSRKLHPDALKSQGREHLYERVSKVFAAISEAQQILSDAEQRDKLRASIEKGEHEPRKDGQDATARAHAVFQSELLAKEGDKLLRVSRFDRALERYREAARYDAEEPDLRAAIAWCEYQLSPKTMDDAARIRAVLAQVIEQAPRIARAHYFLGFVLADQGKASAAVDAFRTASKLDPRLIDAERQARAIGLRTSGPSPAATKKSAGGGGLKGLFGGNKK